MVKIIKKFLFLLSFFFLYLIVKELLVLYQAASSLHPWAGWVLTFLLTAFAVYFIVLPAVRIIAMPRLHRPVRDPERIPALIRRRMRRLRGNPVLEACGFDAEAAGATRDDYERAMAALEPELKKIRKRYVTRVFYLTSVAQNGFLDALIILSTGVNLVRDLFTLYSGRADTRDILYIGKQVYYSMIIGGSEGVEYAADEIISKFFSGSIKNLPFASRIFGSVADGFVNAALLTRISLITENVCRRLFIESERALYPARHTVVSATRILTADIMERVAKELKQLAGDKTKQVLLATVNPVGYIMGRVLDKYADGHESMPEERRIFMHDMSAIAHNPFAFVFRKVREVFRPSLRRAREEEETVF
ncbi:hypothetical protein JXO52_09060 [bacterium]|nr:hypothetical protein [bacterium]